MSALAARSGSATWVTSIAHLTGLWAEIGWDSSKPDGPLRLDVSRAERELGFRMTTEFETGLGCTNDWCVGALAAVPRHPEPMALARTAIR